MRIVIDARMYQESGIGRYIRNLLDYLQKLDKKNEYYILLRNRYDGPDDNTNFKKVQADFGWYGLNEQYKIPKLLNKLKPDLVHFPHFNAPLLYQGKFIVTIHDLIHQHFQMRRATTHDPLIYNLKQWGYKKVFKNAITKSSKILTPSNYVKNLLINDWKIEEKKIVVTPEAVDDKLLTIIAKTSSIKSPYIFYVGNAHPHKNVEGLIKAFLLLQKKYPNLNLVLSGHDHYFWQRLIAENQHQGIIYTGYIDDEELVALYKNAVCFVMPSFEEGFGIPLLEAFACGCPVVSSNAGALPEVGGDAAVYFDPAKPDDMGERIDKVINDESLRKEMIIKGQKRVKLFSWEKLAKQTLEVYNQCV